jgi:hypothetical protein
VASIAITSWQTLDEFEHCRSPFALTIWCSFWFQKITGDIAPERGVLSIRRPVAVMLFLAVQARQVGVG